MGNESVAGGPDSEEGGGEGGCTEADAQQVSGRKGNGQTDGVRGRDLHAKEE